ncbi:MAG: tetratricopeptide repeat protein, partial [Oligoflexia bacterium]|nr:tetratricopeptide repeat protein [Oligoflexia bacterium]
VLAFLFLCALTNNNARLSCFWIALLFAIHPLKVESVSWVTQRKDMLLGVFSFLSMLSWVRGKKEFAMAAFGLALLSKPTAVVIPCVFLLFDVWKSTWRRTWPWWSTAFGISILTFYLHLGNHGTEEIVQAPERYGWVFGISTLEALGFYISKFLMPLNLAVFNEVGVFSLSVFDHVLAITGIVLGLIVLLRGPNRDVTVFMILFALIWFLPHLQIVPHGKYFRVTDHYSYMPLLGFCALLVVGVQWALRSYPKINRALFIVLAAFWGGLSFYQQGFWKNSETLWERNLAIYPNSAVALNSRAFLYLMKGEFSVGRELLLKALESKAEFPNALANLGSLSILEGKYLQAVDYFERAIKQDPSNEGYFKALGDAWVKDKNYEAAVRAFRRGLDKFPYFDPIKIELASALVALHDFKGAADVLRLVPGESDQFPDAQRMLGQIEHVLKRSH